MDCIFCKIAKGEAPAHKILEDEKHLAFLSIFPNTEGFSVRDKIWRQAQFSLARRFGRARSKSKNLKIFKILL